jgi:hypothetical protein
VSSLPRSDDSGCSLGKADFYESAVGAANAISCKNIVDANKFQEERKVIDGVVACLKASVWAHKENRYPWRAPGCRVAAESSSPQSHRGRENF